MGHRRSMAEFEGLTDVNAMAGNVAGPPFTSGRGPLANDNFGDLALGQATVDGQNPALPIIRNIP